MQGIVSFRIFRFLLGMGEAANWPGATKAVAEWFPDRERAWAVALFDSGSSVGGAVAPFLVLFLFRPFGSWRPAFLVTGALGFLWLIAWRMLYRTPEKHPAHYARGTGLHPAGPGAKSRPPRPRPPSDGARCCATGRLGASSSDATLLDPYWFLSNT